MWPSQQHRNTCLLLICSSAVIYVVLVFEYCMYSEAYSHQLLSRGPNSRVLETTFSSQLEHETTAVYGFRQPRNVFIRFFCLNLTVTVLIAGGPNPQNAVASCAPVGIVGIGSFCWDERLLSRSCCFTFIC